MKICTSTCGFLASILRSGDNSTTLLGSFSLAKARIRVQILRAKDNDHAGTLSCIIFLTDLYIAPNSLSLEIRLGTSSTFPPPCRTGGSSNVQTVSHGRGAKVGPKSKIACLPLTVYFENL